VSAQKKRRPVKPIPQSNLIEVHRDPTPGVWYVSLTRREVREAFGAVLKIARGTTDVTQEQLAERASIDVSYASMLERGTRSPNLYVLIKVGLALDVAPELLIAMTLARLRDDA
jgi:ribosome-binding protein aMBF1 (putative translation factor)